MKQRDLLIGGVIAVVTGLSWSVSLAHDNAQISTNSYDAGREWAQRTSASPDDCELAVLGRTGPELDTTAWLQGCGSVAEAQVPPSPPTPPGTSPAAPPSSDAPPPGRPRPR